MAFLVLYEFVASSLEESVGSGPLGVLLALRECVAGEAGNLGSIPTMGTGTCQRASARCLVGCLPVSPQPAFC